MTHVLMRDAARRDLTDHFVYLAEQAEVATADRFLLAAEGSLNLLATRQRWARRSN